jgi:hypothetical protein
LPGITDHYGPESPCITRKEKKILVECKYTAEALRPGQRGGLPKLYQLNSYLDNLRDEPLNNKCHAILLYPLAGLPLKHDYRRSTGQTMSVRTLNLNQDWRGIRSDLLALIA